MIQSLRTAASGMLAQQSCLDVTADNISNISTAGHKRSRAEFSDMLYSHQGRNDNLEIGHGSLLAGVRKEFVQGPLENTGINLDVAIVGKGFFQVMLPDGTTGYTRAGNFSVDGATGKLLSPQDYYLRPEITIPPGSSEIAIDPDGRVTVRGADGERTEVGRMSLVTFTNPNGLLALGRGVFVAGPNAGASVQGYPGVEGIGELKQCYLEQSNVDVVTEMTRMMMAMRAYEMNAKMMQTADESLGQANNILRR